MATVINARDVLMLAAPSRVEQVNLPDNVGTGPRAWIEASSPSFFIATNGVATPDTIILDGLVSGVTFADFPTWSVVVGSATLDPAVNPTGNQSLTRRQLSAAKMQTNLVTVRYTVPYSDGTLGVKRLIGEFTITKIIEGSAGVRGSISLFVTGQNAWSDAVADAAVAQATNTNYKVTGDQVTESNNGGFAETRQWSGGAWVVLQGVLSGSMLATGTVPGTALQSGAVDISKLANQVTSSNYIAGSAGFQIDKANGLLNLYSGVVRGDVRATSTAANAVDSSALQANSVSQLYTSSSATSGNSTSVTVSVPSGASAIAISINAGLYVSGGQTGKAWANFTDNGVTVQAEQFTVISPSAGSHVITATRSNPTNDNTLYTTPMYLSVTVFKK
jgi:hypothetical protein